MMRLLLLVLAFSAAYGFRYDGYHQIEIEPVFTQERADLIDRLVDTDQRLKQVILINDNVSLRTSTSLLIAPNYVQKVVGLLELNNIAYTVSDSDFGRTIDARKEENDLLTAEVLQRMEDGIQAAPTSYLRYDDIVSWLETTASNSLIARTFSAGTSFERRDIRGIEINHLKDALPLVYLDAGVHAREWIAPATALYIIDRILFGTDADAVALRDNYRWVVVPQANPDGYEFSHISDPMWRKTRQKHGVCIGADPNRNFDVNFAGPGTSGSTCSDTYHGPAPYSEPEAAAIRDQLLARSPGMYISLHSYSQLWLVPWGSFLYKPTDYDELMRVGNAAAAAIAGVHGRSFTVGTPPDLIYQASGGSFDWAKHGAGIKYSYTPELRPLGANPGFQLPAVEITPSGEEIFAGVAACVQAADL